MRCACHTEWAHNRGAARCPEGGGWGDGDHDPGESVTVCVCRGYGLKRTLVRDKFLLWCRGVKRVFNAEGF